MSSCLGVASTALLARANLVCPSKHLPVRSASILEAGSGERHTVATAVASALLSAHLGYDLIKTYARLQTGGNIRAFLALMMTCDKGAASPMVLMKLRTEKDVTVVRPQSGAACE